MVKWLFSILMALCLLSFNSYSQWEKANGGKALPDSTAISAILTNGNTIIAATAAKGIFYSTDNGESWTQKNNGLEELTGILALGIKDNLIFIGTMDNGVYVASNSCDSWVSKNNGMKGEAVLSFLVKGNNIFAGTSSGIYISSDNGNNWIAKNQGLEDYESTSFYSLAIKGNTIFAGTYDGVYTSTNNGDNWLHNNYHDLVASIIVHKNNIYISGDGYNTGIHVSTDNGSTWVAKNNGMDISASTKFYLLSFGDSVYTGATRQGVFLTNDNGNNWIQYSDGLSPYAQGFDIMLATNEKYLFVGSAGASGFCTLWRRQHYEIQDTEAVEDDDYYSKILEIFPNPANDKLNLKIDLTNDEIISITLDDVLGNSIIIANHELISKGINNISVSLTDLSPGTYYIRLMTSRGTIVRTIVKI